MGTGFKPLLAPREEPLSYPQFFEELSFPMYWSPKIDGIRGIPKNGVVLSRTAKPLRSFQVQEEFGKFEHFDGELIEGNITDLDVYNRTQSHVMSFDNPGNMSFHVFDYTHPDVLKWGFEERFDKLLYLVDSGQVILPENVKVVPQKLISHLDDLLEFEDKMIKLGYEGLMGKCPVSHYKEGRATWREQIIVKLKRYQDGEGVLVDIEEGEINQNEQTRDEQGYAFRSSSKDGKVPSGMAGKYKVHFEPFGVIDVAPGNFSHDQRRDHLYRKSAFIGRMVKFRWMSHGVKDFPRHPRAVGFRDKMDM